MLYEYAGVVYSSRSKMCAARREHYVELLRQGLNFTQAAKVVGVSKRTGKVWRNGRTRSSGRNEKASVAWYCAKMEIPEGVGNVDNLGHVINAHRRHHRDVRRERRQAANYR